MKPTINLVGKTFGRWTVLVREKSGNNEPRWLCQCACKTRKVVLGKNLRYGLSKSCGCITKEHPHNLKHGYSGGVKPSSTYTIWNNMRMRCNNTEDKNYGGRGIKVCDEWHKFENFLNDMGERPSKKHSIDRIDNNGDYRPGNCRWATGTEQANNTRANRFITFNGKTHTLAEWGRISNITVSNIDNRLHRGWSIERIFGEPLHKR